MEPVDEIIDQVGSGYRDGRSQKDLFGDISFRVGKLETPQSLVLPPRDSLELVEFLSICLAARSPYRVCLILHLSKELSTCTLESLYIEGASFPLRNRSALRTCFGALSGGLSSLEFTACYFDREPLRDILVIRDTKVNLTFMVYYQGGSDGPAQNNLHSESVNQGSARMLRVITGGGCEPNERFLTNLSKLSVLFSLLEVEVCECGKSPDTTQDLININAEVLSVKVVSGTLPCPEFPLSPINPRTGTDGRWLSVFVPQPPSVYQPLRICVGLPWLYRGNTCYCPQDAPGGR